MRKTMKYLCLLFTIILLTACSKEKSTSENESKSEEANQVEDTLNNVTQNENKNEDISDETEDKEGSNIENSNPEDSNIEGDDTDDNNANEDSTDEDKKEDSTDENNKDENNKDEDNKGDKDAIETEEEPATISDVIPNKYQTSRKDHAGTIEHISYQTFDYFGDNAEITKYAYVYLPYEYDESKQNNVLYLMHGIGGNEKEWGMFNEYSRVKSMMDNLIYYGDIEPFIVVVPNGRSSVDFANTSSDFNSFYLFGKELRNDLIPFIDRTYATYADYDENGYDLAEARDHRAMAGLSMGGMQTINIGMCESLDLLSNFGAFSQAPTTYTSSQIATKLSEYPDYDIHYFYSICGKQDGIAYNSSINSVGTLTSLTDKLVDGENFMWHEVNGGHDFNIWFLGFYNFAQLVFQNVVE